MRDANIAPVFACLYPGLCDVARRHGYALAIHGSVVTDLDLIAVPWIAEAVTAEELKTALMTHIGACGYADLLRRESILTEEQVQQTLARKENRRSDEAELKLHGRLAWNLYLESGIKIDLSILPRITLHEISHVID